MNDWDALDHATREAIKSRIVECLADGESAIPGKVMNPKMADRLLPGAFDAMMVSENEILVDVLENEVVLRLGRP